MSRWRKRPVEVEAFRWCNPARDEAVPERIPQWLREAINDGVVVLQLPDLMIRTLEGTMRAEPGDWIICGVKGELYPCKPGIFEQTYEAADVIAEDPPTIGQRVLVLLVLLAIPVTMFWAEVQR